MSSPATPSDSARVDAAASAHPTATAPRSRGTSRGTAPATGRPRRGGGMRRRGKEPEGPRASLKQLLPFIFEHKRILVVVVVLSIFGAA
ncbi:MAG TPA: hypothetical protein PLB94_05650, partial [Microbacteriaceae bacterium]|nr:hypothetical protein [Microbacteriaceae bacterium]